MIDRGRDRRSHRSVTRQGPGGRRRPAWSPDGQRLLIERSITADDVGAPFVAVIDRRRREAPDRGAAVHRRPTTGSPCGRPMARRSWRPRAIDDGNRLQQQLWDARTGEARPAPWTATSFPSWQRDRAFRTEHSARRRTILRRRVLALDRPSADAAGGTRLRPARARWLSSPAERRSEDRMIRTSPFHKRTSALNETGPVEPLVRVTSPRTATRCRTSSSTSRSATPPACSTRRRSTSTGSTVATRSGSWPGSSPATSAPARRATPSTRPGATTAASSSRTASSCGPAADEFLLTAAEPNLAYFEDLIGRRDDVAIEEVSDDYGILAIQGPRSRDLLAALVPGVATIPFFGLTTGRSRARR